METGVIEVELDGNNKSCASRLYSTYPIRFVERSFGSQNEYLTLYILGFGGGLVSGDATSIQCLVRKGTTLTLRTTGSTKVFKTVGNKITKQDLHYNIESGGLLAAIPDATVCYKDASFTQRQFINLEQTGSLILCDWFSSGRQNFGENWSARLIKTEIRIAIEGRVLFHENCAIAQSSTSSAAEKVGHFAIIGSLILIGPRTLELRKRLSSLNQRQSFDDMSASSKRKRDESSSEGSDRTLMIEQSGFLVSVADLEDGISVVRFACDLMEDAYQFLVEALSPLNLDMPGINLFSDKLHSGQFGIDRSELSNHMRLLKQSDKSS